MDSVVVSVRIRKETKSRLEREGINVEDAVKDFLNRRAEQIELKKTMDRLGKIIEKHVKPSKSGFAINSIRSDRRALS